MIAYGTAVTDEDTYGRYGLAGINKVAEPDSLIMARRGMSLQRAYNEMLAEAVTCDELEAVVFPHQDLRIEDPDFTGKLRSVLADPTIAIVGACGARGVRNGSWFADTSAIGRLGAVIHGELVWLGWHEAFELTEVDAVDGALLIFSTWAARNLRFDTRFERCFHGYDTDISFEARARGKRVAVADLAAVHDSFGKIGPRRGSWVRAMLDFDEKWARAPLLRAPEAAYEATSQPAYLGLSARPKLERTLQAERRRLLEQLTLSAPVPGTAKPPERVALNLRGSVREHWLARLRQHTSDCYAGVPLLKLPEDLRVYEHLIWLSRADTVIELGAFCGGSALWLRDRLITLGRYWGAPPPQVVTIDEVTGRMLGHLEYADPDYAATIKVIEGDLLDPELPRRVSEVLRPEARCLVLEDSAHIYETTMAALCGFAQFVGEQGFFVVEDTVCDVEELRLEDMPRGPLLALQDWLTTPQGADFTVRDDLELYGLTNNPGGYLQRRTRAPDGSGNGVRAHT